MLTFIGGILVGCLVTLVIVVGGLWLRTGAWIWDIFREYRSHES